MGVNRDGTLKGYSLDVLSNTGAYASHGHSIASAGGNKVAYLYPRCAYAYSSKTCYTNLPSAGAMRGYGAPQVVFAVESMLDDAATALGIDPVEIRLRNAAREGDANPLTGKRIYSAGLPECLEKGRKILNGKNAVQSARTSKAIYVVALASPVLATPLTPGLSA